MSGPRHARAHTHSSCISAVAAEDPAAVGRLHDAITNPGAVKINVKGAFIVDDEQESNGNGNGNGNSHADAVVACDGVHYEHKDIRLPHHTGLVSHVAVDVSSSLSK